MKVGRGLGLTTIMNAAPLEIMGGMSRELEGSEETYLVAAIPKVRVLSAKD